MNFKEDMPFFVFQNTEKSRFETLLRFVRNSSSKHIRQAVRDDKELLNMKNLTGDNAFLHSCEHSSLMIVKMFLTEFGSDIQVSGRISNWAWGRRKYAPQRENPNIFGFLGYVLKNLFLTPWECTGAYWVGRASDWKPWIVVVMGGIVFLQR